MDGTPDQTTLPCFQVRVPSAPEVEAIEQLSVAQGSQAGDRQQQQQQQQAAAAAAVATTRRIWRQQLRPRRRRVVVPLSQGIAFTSLWWELYLQQAVSREGLRQRLLSGLQPSWRNPAQQRVVTRHSPTWSVSPVPFFSVLVFFFPSPFPIR